MKTATFAAVVFVVVMSMGLVQAQNPGDNIFSGIQVHTINIRFAQPNYWNSLTIYYNEGKERYIPATVIADGVTYDSVGVRFRGHSFYTHPNNKKPFRLSFGEYRSAQRWDGLKGIHLNNCWEDPTSLREKLHLDFCRATGIPAPRANFARLFINDTLFAFYSMVEHVDKRFLKSRYGDDAGDLFKAVDGFGAGSDKILSDFRWLGSDTSLYLNNYELKTEESTSGWRKLVAFIDTLNNSAAPSVVLPKIINLNAVYKAFATDILFGNLDSYLSSGRNFYIYFHPTTNKIEWIVWDTGLSFAGMPSSGVSNVERLSVTYVSNATQRPLLGKVLNATALKKTICALSALCSTNIFPRPDYFLILIASLILFARMSMPIRERCTPINSSRRIW
ncbi:MAG: CotH kinase family protein [candidate division KSB1 bacterium]|nr:CotH kinase family protein [candidate division KSB1 bacterium]MDZ7300598.1 CotH kinase family protein [candidate division KSB1 bacterium]MDZ7309735.1 CotH kinase family protein [candidate division KSB1 bacterium]